MLYLEELRHNEHNLKKNEVYIQLIYQKIGTNIGSNDGSIEEYETKIKINDDKEMVLLFEALELIIKFSNKRYTAFMNTEREYYKYWDILEKYNLIKYGVEHLLQYNIEFKDGNNVVSKLLVRD